MEGLPDVVDYTTHFMGDWTGAGACTSHHGSQCCYVDAANLAAAHVVDSGKSWAFTRCMFASQKALCPKTWDDGKQECGTEAYDAASFRNVSAACAAAAGFADAEVAKLVDAVGALAPGDWVHDALVADYAYTTANNPGSPHPGWVVVDGEFVDSGKYPGDGADWAKAVVAKVCASYGGAAPAGC